MRIPVHVHAEDSITRSGLAAQLRPDPQVSLVESAEVDPNAVVVAAVDLLGPEALRQLRALACRCAGRVVLVTGAIDDTSLLAVIEIGVRAVVHRNEATPTRLIHAILRTTRDEAALPADVLARLLKQVSRLQHHVLAPHGLMVSGLSVREGDVLRLVADGFDTEEIAVKLSFSARTVKNVLSAVTTRYNLRNRAHAVAFVIREGLI